MHTNFVSIDIDIVYMCSVKVGIGKYQTFQILVVQLLHIKNFESEWRTGMIYLFGSVMILTIFVLQDNVTSNFQRTTYRILYKKKFYLLNKISLWKILKGWSGVGPIGLTLYAPLTIKIHTHWFLKNFPDTH